VQSIGNPDFDVRRGAAEATIRGEWSPTRNLREHVAVPAGPSWTCSEGQDEWTICPRCP